MNTKNGNTTTLRKISSATLVALSVLLTACSGDWCKSKSSAASSTTASTAPAASSTAEAPKATNVVFFEFDSSKLSDEGTAVVKTHADKLKGNKDAKPTVTGHCSEEGSEAYNNGLGERRANAVAEALEAHGANKPAVVSYGKSADFGEGLEKNRRALIHEGEVAGIPNGKAVAKKEKAASKKLRMKKAKKSATKADAKTDAKVEAAAPAVSAPVAAAPAPAAEAPATPAAA